MTAAVPASPAMSNKKNASLQSISDTQPSETQLDYAADDFVYVRMAREPPSRNLLQLTFLCLSMDAEQQRQEGALQRYHHQQDGWSRASLAKPSPELRLMLSFCTAARHLHQTLSMCSVSRLPDVVSPPPIISIAAGSTQMSLPHSITFNGQCLWF